MAGRKIVVVTAILPLSSSVFYSFSSGVICPYLAAYATHDRESASNVMYMTAMGFNL